jgi:hypothetical protein
MSARLYEWPDKPNSFGCARFFSPNGGCHVTITRQAHDPYRPNSVSTRGSGRSVNELHGLRLELDFVAREYDLRADLEQVSLPGILALNSGAVRLAKALQATMT